MQPLLIYMRLAWSNLRFFNLETGGNGDTHAVTPELVKQVIESLKDEKQRDFISRCLEREASKRPSAKELLFHPLLFEVPSLRLIAMHQLIANMQSEAVKTNAEVTFNDNDFRREPDFIIATCGHEEASSAKQVQFKYSSLAQFDPNKYYEDVRNGIYPLTAYGLSQPVKTLPSGSNSYSESMQQQASYSAVSLSDMRSSNSPSIKSESNSRTNTNTSGSLSSASSSSSTSPSQSLCQGILPPNAVSSQSSLTDINYMQQQTYSPPPPTPLAAMTNNIEDLVDQEILFDMQPPHSIAQYSNSSSNSSTAPTPTPMQQQQFVYPVQQMVDQFSRYTSPSASPPPPQVQPFQQQQVYNSTGAIPIARSLSKSPVRDSTSNSLQLTESLKQMDDLSSAERRHAEKMEFNLELIERQNIYKLSLNITFEDNTSRFVESQITHTDTANKLAEELIAFGLVSKLDQESLYNTLSTALSARAFSSGAESVEQATFYLNK